jgi:tRNA-2-methylthio-N6-dimethylallyladenosine synthase
MSDTATTPDVLTDTPESARKARVYIETYGCQMNVADTELMFGGLVKEGWEVAKSLDEADVILMNTCAVREKAEDRVYGRASQLLRFKYTNPNLVLGITGCMAEHLKEKIIEKAPYIDVVVGPDAYRRLPAILQQATGKDPIIDVRLDKQETYDGMTPARGPGVSGWVTIQRGCDKFCTFCIVPYTRGRERGTSPRETLRQVRELADMGYREVSLLGQTVNSYRYEDVDFADLLRSVASIPGIDRVRYTSPYPVDFNSKLIETLATLPNVPRYLHLPLQSGSDAVLNHMNRGYSLQEFRQIVADLRQAMPDIAISTDMIVGYPTETEDDYEASMAVMRELRFDSAFMFAYSEREGTLASKKIPDVITPEVKQQRLARMIAQQEAISGEKYRQRVGTVVEVLVEGLSRKGEGWFGKSGDFKTTVVAHDDRLRAGSLARVYVDTATSHTLFGHVVPDDQQKAVR